jgi:hypothetical protein
LGLLKEPRESRKGLAGKPEPTIFDRVVRWKKAKPSKSQMEARRQLTKIGKSSIKYLKDLYDGKGTEL